MRLDRLGQFPAARTPQALVGPDRLDGESPPEDDCVLAGLGLAVPVPLEQLRHPARARTALCCGFSVKVL